MLPPSSHPPRQNTTQYTYNQAFNPFFVEFRFVTSFFPRIFATKFTPHTIFGMKTKYQAPTVKVVEIRTEIGFAGSFRRKDDGVIEMMFSDESPRNEQYQFENNFWEPNMED